MYYLITDIYIFGVFLSHLCSGQKTFTVEEAVETIGFGRFHIALFLIMGSTGVSVCNQHHQPDETLPSFSLLLCNNNYKSPQKHIAAHFFPTYTFSSRIPACVNFDQNQHWPTLILSLFQGKSKQVDPGHPGLSPALEFHPSTTEVQGYLDQVTRVTSQLTTCKGAELTVKQW